MKSQATKQGNLPQHHRCRHWGDDLCHGRSPLLTLHICEIFVKKSLLKCSITSGQFFGIFFDTFWKLFGPFLTVEPLMDQF